MDWYCVVVNERFNKEENFENISNELKKSLNTENVFRFEKNESFALEDYFFVSCANFVDKIPLLKNSIYFAGVLPSYENPKPISNEEIELLKQSVVKKNEKVFYYGDVVLVKNGLYSNLYGIFLSNVDEKCKVGFKFCAKKFIEEISFKDLEKTTNIFNHIRIPIRCIKKK